MKVMLGRTWKGLPLYDSLAAVANPPVEHCMSLDTLQCDNVMQKSREGVREVQVVAT